MVAAMAVAAATIARVNYVPTVNCECKPMAKACRWISWSNGQPAHRYYRCRKARVRHPSNLPPLIPFLWLL
jgi:hypothetical protein